MKSENYNLVVHALDDQVLYKEICRKIKEMETVSFQLICLVPLLSVIVSIILGFYASFFPDSLLVMLGLFGASITFFISRWEAKNAQRKNVFRSYAEILETKKMQMERESSTSDILTGGPYSLWRNNMDATSLKDSENSKISKINPEMAIYYATILLWLFVSIHRWLS